MAKRVVSVPYAAEAAADESQDDLGSAAILELWRTAHGQVGKGGPQHPIPSMGRHETQVQGKDRTCADRTPHTTNGVFSPAEPDEARAEDNAAHGISTAEGECFLWNGATARLCAAFPWAR